MRNRSVPFVFACYLPLLFYSCAQKASSGKELSLLAVLAPPAEDLDPTMDIQVRRLIWDSAVAIESSVPRQPERAENWKRIPDELEWRLPPENDILVMFLPLQRQYPETGNVLPVLADRLEHSDDYTEWTFFLRRDVKWYDGVQVKFFIPVIPPFIAHRWINGLHSSLGHYPEQIIEHLRIEEEK